MLISLFLSPDEPFIQVYGETRWDKFHHFQHQHWNGHLLIVCEVLQSPHPYTTAFRCVSFVWLANCEFVLCISSVCLPYTCNRSPVYIQETGIYTAITHIPPHNSHSVYAGFSVPRRFVPFSLHLRNRDLCVGKASVGWGRPFRGGSSAM